MDFNITFLDIAFIVITFISIGLWQGKKQHEATKKNEENKKINLA